MIESSSYSPRKVSARRLQPSRRPANLDLAWTTASAVKASLSCSASAPAPGVAALDASTSASTRPNFDASRISSNVTVAKHPYSSFSTNASSTAVTPPMTSLFTAASLQTQRSRSPSRLSSHTKKLPATPDKTIRLLKRGSLDMLLLENPSPSISRRRLSRSISPLGFLTSRLISSTTKDTFASSSSSRTQIGVIVSLESNVDSFSLDETTKPKVGRNTSVFRLPYQNILRSSLASPNARDPSAFEIDQMSLCGSPSVPASLGSGSRWTPPNDWNVFDDDFEPSALGVMTPRSPEHPEPVAYLQVLFKSPGHSILAASSFKTGKMRITEQSTVSLSPLSSIGSLGMGHMTSQLRSNQTWILTVTGEDQMQRDRSHPLSSLSSSSGEPEGSSSDFLEWSFTSASLEQLSVWHELIETQINDLKGYGQNDDPRARWSTHDFGDDLDRFPMPMGAQQSDLPANSEACLPTHASSSSSSQTEFCRGVKHSMAEDQEDAREGSEDEPECLGLQDLRKASTRSSAHSYVYTLEDSYRSIMQRYSDHNLHSPVDCLRTPRAVGFDRRLSIDVPMSPCSYDLVDRAFDSNYERPGSPVDPWISIKEMDLPLMTKNDASAEDAAFDLLSEGFRWDTSPPCSDTGEVYTADSGVTWRHVSI